MVTEKATKERILQTCHDDKVGGCHFGRDRTVEKVSTQFYWKGIYSDVEDWVSLVGANSTYLFCYMSLQVKPANHILLVLLLVTAGKAL